MTGLARYVTVRLAAMAAALFIVAFVSFVLLRLMPGDPASAMLPITAQLWEIEAMRAQLGLDDPLPVQFGRYLVRIVRLDFGNSLFFRQPVCIF